MWEGTRNPDVELGVRCSKPVGVKMVGGFPVTHTEKDRKGSLFYISIMRSAAALVLLFVTFFNTVSDKICSAG